MLTDKGYQGPYSSGVSGFFEDLSGRPDLLLFLAAFQSANLLLHPHAQTLHHLYAETAVNRETFLMASASRTCTHLLSRAGDQALVQPESLFLGETLGLVVPKQSTLDLSHTHKERGGAGGGRSEDGRCLRSSVSGTQDEFICMVIRRQKKTVVIRAERTGSF